MIVAHRDSADRRAYQREFYKSPAQKKRRAKIQAAWKKRMRTRIFTRDGYRCVHCGESGDDSTLHIDHLVARILGGKDTDENRVTSCEWCNKSKGGKPVCRKCKTWKTPERHDERVRCVQCGALDSFPPGTPTTDPNADPDWITSGAVDEDGSQLGN